MAKGDKKKKVEKSTAEASSSKLASGSATSVVSEPPLEQVTPEADDSGQNTNCSSASLSSQLPLIENPAPREELCDVPVLSSVIVQRYEGEKCRELFHGEGVAYFQGGHVYKGMFSKGYMHGHGIYIWADGVKYEGEFVSNMAMGNGTYTWVDGSRYEGEVCHGIRHGFGTFTCARKTISYRGQWSHGKRHGKGTIYYDPECASWYEGDWVSNVREGFGVHRYPSGNVYEGQWQNNARHGEGTMKWTELGEQYSGQWEHGLQHGQGTHSWLLRRAPGSQYPQRNQYVGQFVRGFRHGPGKFYYASGALYDGDWKNNKKHGQGRFTFKNGRIFEGEFVEDHMAEFPAFSMGGTSTPDLSGIRTCTPPCGTGEQPRTPVNGSPGSDSLLGPDMALEVQGLLEGLPDAPRDVELRQVEFAVLRHMAELRTFYSFYSSLGHQESLDNTFLLSRMQFWRLLKDCGLHHGGITLAQVDRLLRGNVPLEEVHSPFGTMFFRTFVSCIVALAYHICHREMESSDNILTTCFSTLMRENIIPNAKKVKGRFLCDAARAAVCSLYIERCWAIYQAVCRPGASRHTDRTMTMRHFVWMMEDLGLYDDQLTVGKVLEILCAESPDPRAMACFNLDLEITFLEFFEALLGCAEVKWSSWVEPVYVELSPPQDSQTQSQHEAAQKSKTLQRSSTGEKILKESEDSAENLKAEAEDPAGHSRGGADSEMDQWVDAVHCFFSGTLFPAYERRALLHREAGAERLRRAAADRIALAKAQRAARLRELCKEEEERREEEDEEEVERADAPEEDPHPSQSLAFPIPAASSTCITNPTPPHSASGTRSRR